VCQFGLTLLGLGGHEFGGGDHGDMDHGDLDMDHGDADMDHGAGADDGLDPDGHHDQHQSGAHQSTWLFGVISFRTLVAAVAFFGIAGMAARTAGLSLPNQMLVAAASGVGAMYLVHWLMSLLYRLGEDNTLSIRRAVGRQARVHVSIPAGKSGPGKIQLELQGRLMEYAAVTAVPSGLPTGATVIVVSVVGSDTLEVAPAEQQGVV
jgi:membrane protein implicated in regulation of membrane protease activity